MLSLWVMEHLDIVRHVLPRLGSRFIDPAPSTFPLEQIKEAIQDRAVMTVSAPAHRMLQSVRFRTDAQSLLVNCPPALVRVGQYSVLRFLKPHRNEQCLQDDICGLTALH